VRALVVDGSRVMRNIVARIVKQLGFAVVEAGDGPEALAALQALPDTGLVLVDWNTPVMNGLEFVTALRADQRWNAVKVVLVTTESDLSQVEEALAAGANEYVVKPFTPELLIDKLTRLGLTDGTEA